MKLDYQKYAETARTLAAEGCVLLENRNGTLPVRKGDCVSVFGRIQKETYYCGTGSGGLVNPPYVVSVLEGIQAQCSVNQELIRTYEMWLCDHPYDIGKGWAQEPWSQDEMPVSRELAEKAALCSNVAVVVIGRTAGEDQDNTASPGAYFLSDKEEEMIKNVCAAFDRVAVLLNVGSIIDMSWVEKYHPGAVLYIWQGGCEGGNAAADVLTGRVNPCGHLADTIAGKISDYPAYRNFGDPSENCYAEDIYVGYRYFETFAPEKVLYPFGYGLSYTEFSQEILCCRVQAKKIEIEIRITNSGSVAGKYVVQIYCCPPQGKLGKPTRSLIDFHKTKLLNPGEQQLLRFSLPLTQLASYDDSGKTGHPYAWVMEPGEYVFYAGSDVRSAEKAGAWNLTEIQIVENLKQAMAPVKSFERIIPGKKKEKYEEKYETVPLRKYDIAQRIQEELPDNTASVKEKRYLWQDVKNQKISLDEFLSQFTDQELICMTRGEGMCSPKVTPGTAGAFGGQTELFRTFGIPVCCCADGPSGIRMDCGAMAFSLPNGTAIACSYNRTLTEELFSFLALELIKNKVDTLLGPGINIHRYPLCGRNFEYFSEDPLLTGTMASAELVAMNQYHVTGTIKHFACNDQENQRRTVNALVSERALREIYLKAFEIAVKEGNARSIMTSYNPVNGIWSASNYDLLTTILREQWGYSGIVMTDWWADMNEENQEPSRSNTAEMIRAQNDLYMVVKDAETHEDNSLNAVRTGRLTRGEILRNIRNICKFILSSPASMDSDFSQKLEICNQPAFQNVIKTDKIYSIGKDETVLELPSETKRGTRIDYRLHIDCPGQYDLYYQFHTCQKSQVAQVPVSIFINQELICTLTLRGTSKIKDNISFTLSQDAVLELYFGDTGLFVDELLVK